MNGLGPLAGQPMGTTGPFCIRRMKILLSAFGFPGVLSLSRLRWGVWCEVSFKVKVLPTPPPSISTRPVFGTPLRITTCIGSSLSTWKFYLPFDPFLLTSCLVVR